MNHLAQKVEAVLEVIIGEGSNSKTSLIYASRINGNGSWRYERNNGQTYPIMKMNPEEMSQKLVEASKKKGYPFYQVHYFWRPIKGQEKEGIKFQRN